MRRFLAAFAVCLSVVCPLTAAAQSTSKKLGVRVPAGFEVTLYADDDLAHDIYSMTFDSLGRVVVSGPGYVRILIDSDGDGRADKFRQFADGPKTGAQGMYFHGRDLLCTGDAGLIRYRDQNGDDRADGPPQGLLKLKTGGEHHAHSVQKGPDGWWYLIAGNNAGVTSKYATLKTSPIRKPESGTLIRLKPDFTGGEIVTDGFRNSYDFAFSREGDIFVYDSDGERDVSLPWYRPTRIFHALPGAHAGWFSRSWKRPDGFFEMPPVVGSFGRGSPTGVACYQHRQFPKKYRNAVFALDWTFGRVTALPLEADGATFKSKPISFMTGVGQFGFAPTDVAVGPDGSLFVSVGGRGTRGGVYRIRYTGSKTEFDRKTSGSKLLACLDAPQPLSSWSRAKWLPLARKLGAAKFTRAAMTESLAPQQRVRAIEILTELFGGVQPLTLTWLASSRSAEVRARAVWSYSRAFGGFPELKRVAPFLTDKSPMVRRAALEALLPADPGTDFTTVLPQLVKTLEDSDRFVRQTASRIAGRLSQTTANQLEKLTRTTSLRSFLAFYIGRRERKEEFAANLVTLAMQVLERRYSAASKLEAVRFLQLGLGDVGPRKNRPPVYDSYASRIDLTRHERQLDKLRIRIAKVFPTEDKTLDYELARVIAMLSPYNPKLLDAVLKKINDQSDPIDDIHYLIVASRIGVERTTQRRKQIAAGLIALDAKIRARKLKVDSNWDDRVGEMYQKHAEIDADLALEIIRHPQFGRSEHVHFLNRLQRKHWQSAIDAFARQVQKSNDYHWSNDIVFLLADSENAKHRELLRKQYANLSVRNAVLIVLATQPEPRDRSKFVAGLSSGQMEVLSACEDALEKLPRSESSKEQFQLLKTIRRLGRDKQEVPHRDRLVNILRRNNGQNFGFALKTQNHPSHSQAVSQWTRWLRNKYPDDAQRYLSTSSGDLAQLKKQLASVDWTKGDAARGKKLFTARSCAQCHGGRRALGPDLAGAARRFSRDDLFTAILQPNRDVSPRYQTTLIQTASGKTYTGLVIYNSVDGVTLRNGTNQTYRIEADDIEARRTLNQSLMPAGLLKGLKPEDFADLYAYIRSETR